MDGVIKMGISNETKNGNIQVVPMDIPIFIYAISEGSEEQLESKFKETESLGEQYYLLELGVVVNFGELRAFVDFRVSVQATNFVVSKLSRLFEMKRGNFWLLVTCLCYETYLRFQEMFPSLEQDWDLHLLLVPSKSSFMKSFVPLAGFFSCLLDSSDSPNTNNQQYPITCYLCMEKYEQELRDILKDQPTDVPLFPSIAIVSFAVQPSELHSLSPSPSCPDRGLIARDHHRLNGRFRSLKLQVCIFTLWFAPLLFSSITLFLSSFIIFSLFAFLPLTNLQASQVVFCYHCWVHCCFLEDVCWFWSSGCVSSLGLCMIFGVLIVFVKCVWVKFRSF